MKKKKRSSLDIVRKMLNRIKRGEERKDVKEIMIGNEIEKEIEVSSGVVMRYGENGERLILLIQRSEDDHWPLHWEYPRGKCDKPVGEDIIHCLKREVKEETGLDVKPVTFLGTYEYLAEKGKRKSICYTYLCKMINPDQKVKLSKEHSNYKWVSEAGQVELMVMPDQFKILQKVLNPERKIINIPTNKFSQNNSLEEYLKILQDKRI